MLLAVWGTLASPGATFIAGVASLACLFYHGRHIDRDRSLHSANVVFAPMQGAVLYILLVTIVFHWLGGIPMSRTLTEGFGQERFGWVFYGMAADILMRMLQMYYPKS